MSQIEKVLNRMKEAGAKLSILDFPYPIEVPEFGPGCHQVEIDEIEENWPLPTDYREYLLLCRYINAADVFNGYFLFSPIGIATADGPKILHVEIDGGLDEVQVAAIGGDGGGNLFLMGRSPNAAGEVWKWNHEYPPRFDGVSSDGLLFVAASFTEFLERVADDWEHFVADDRDWSYISG